MIFLKEAFRVKYHPVQSQGGVMADFKGSIVEFPANGRKVRGYLSRPETGRGPGVIVIQEWWGLVDHIKDVADRFAAEGFVALAPDLYHGEATRSPDEAGKLMMALEIDETEKDLRSAASYLKSQSSGAELGVIGFCMGGQLALFAASRNESIGASVDFYGIHPNVKPEYERIRAPVLGLFAEKDAFVTPEAVRKLEEALKAAGVSTEFHVYPDVDHAFFNDTRAEVYDRRASEDAWRRVLAFFREHLGNA